MRDERILISVIFTSYFVREIWTLFPDYSVSPFLFSDCELSLQSYIWIASIYTMLMLFSFVLMWYSEYFRCFYQLLFCIQAVELIEYFLNYNEAWFVFSGVNINVANLRYVLLFSYIVNKFQKHG